MAQKYKIKNINSGKYLTALSGTVKMESFSDGTNQKWEKEKSGNVTYLKVYVDGSYVYLHFLDVGENAEVDSTSKTSIIFVDAGGQTCYIQDAETDHILAEDGTSVVVKEEAGSADTKKWKMEYV